MYPPIIFRATINQTQMMNKDPQNFPELNLTTNGILSTWPILMQNPKHMLILTSLKVTPHSQQNG